jgi:hypothetical protein
MSALEDDCEHRTLMTQRLNLLPLNQLLRAIITRICGEGHSNHSSSNWSARLLVCVLSIMAVAPAMSQQADFAPPFAPDRFGRSSGSQRPTTLLQNPCNFLPAAIAPAPEDNVFAPKVFNSSLRARAGDIIFLQGANLTPSTRVFLDVPGGTSSQLSVVNHVEPGWIATQIPPNISGAFEVRAVNDYGSSSAIRINAPVPYHLDTTQMASGGHFRIFGRNLVYATCKPRVSVEGLPADVDVTSSRDYMLDVRAPLGITPTEAAEILIDNGGGLGPTLLEGGVRVIAGAGDPLKLDVGWGASFDFAGRVISSTAACDGLSDDTAAIRRAISSAGELGAIVQLPRGTCRIAATIDLESKVVLRGAGRNETILRYEGNYPISADSKDLVGLENLQLLNAGSAQEGVLWRGNTRSFIRHVTINMGVSRQWFLTDNRDFVFDDNLVIQTGSYDQQNPYRFDRCMGLLFSNNRSINVSGSPTFQSVHDTAFINNRFTRDARSQDETTVIAHHGFVVDFARRVSIVGNTFDVVDGPITNKQRNDGETILVEGGGPDRTESLGVVKAVGADFVSDPENTLMAKRWHDHRQLNLGIAVVSGIGAGQTRRVVGYENGTVRVDPPWDVQPEVGSHYASFVWGLDKVLIIGNTLSDNPRGIWLYQSSIRDVVIRSNEIRNGGGIYLRSYEDVATNIFTIQLDTTIEDNTITNWTGNWMSHIILVCVTADENTFGVGQLGIEVRRNTIVANQPNLTSAQEEYAAHEGYAAVVRVERSQPPSTFLPKLIGPIFQDNSCVNCERPFTTGVGVAGAVFSGNTVKPTTGHSTVRDLDIANRPIGGSTATVIR